MVSGLGNLLLPAQIGRGPQLALNPGGHRRRNGALDGWAQAIGAVSLFRGQINWIWRWEILSETAAIASHERGVGHGST